MSMFIPFIRRRASPQDPTSGTQQMFKPPSAFGGPGPLSGDVRSPFTSQQ